MITQEQITQKAAELSQQTGRKVFPLVFMHEGENGAEQIVGYMQNPTRVVKMKAFDKTVVSQASAGAELLEHCLLKEHSDERIYSEKEEYDHIFLGACIAALNNIKVAVEQSALDKKK